jgi:hypothetical protein
VGEGRAGAVVGEQEAAENGSAKANEFAREARADRAHGVTVRAIILGLILIVINNWWLFHMEIVHLSGHPTTTSIFFNSVFILVFLVCANGLVRRVKPEWPLSQAEMLTVYVMINIATCLGGHDMIQVLVPEMCYPFKYATASNGWAGMFLKWLPSWLTVRDPNAVKLFFTGGGSIYHPDVLKFWIVPVAMWSVFIMGLMWVMLCMTVLLRKQWTEREKLTYPLVQLPLDLTAEKTPFFRNKLLWLGFAIAAVIDIIQGLHVLFPSIPGIPIKELDLRTYCTTFPWTAIGWVPMRFYPFGIGLGFLLPLDLSFSTWFFFWFWKAQILITAIYGLWSIPRFPYINEQSFGAYMGLAFFAVWISRKQFAGMFVKVIRGVSEPDESREPVSYRTAVMGVTIGLLGLGVFLHRMGMSVWVVVPFFVIYLGLSVAITRMRAELGPPAHDLHMAGPEAMIPAMVGPMNLGKANLVALTLTYWFNRAYRAHPMPFMLEGFKTAEKARMGYRRLFVAIMLAVAAGTLVTFWSELHTYYVRGAAAKTQWVPLVFASEPYNRLDGWLRGTAAPTDNTVSAVLVGFGFTFLLQMLRMRLPWFPFHPVGYAVSSSWSMNMLWMCMFIAWAIKLMVMRYGGLKMYRRLMPFFLGIVLGECITGSLWSIIGMVLNVDTYSFWS